MDWPWLFGRQFGSTLSSGDKDSPQTTAMDSQNPATTDSSPSKQGVAGTPAEGSGPFINFDPGSFPDDHVWTFESPSVSLSWTRKSNSVMVEEVEWRGKNDSSSKEYVSIARTQIGGGGESRIPGEGNSQSESANLLHVIDTGSTDLTGGVELGLDYFFDTARFRLFQGQEMVVVVRWADTEDRGNTTSDPFTAVLDKKDVKWTYDPSSEDARGFETLESNDRTVQPGSAGSSAISSSSNAASTETTSSIGETGPSDGGRSREGGLPTGAIAGIAVGGAVVLLALIGGVVFWALRRRHRDKALGQYGKPTPSTTFMSGDKEAHQIIDSPHSTFSSDQQVPLSNLAAGSSPPDPGTTVGHNHLYHHREPGHYTPYHDDERRPESPAMRELSNSEGAGHGVSRTVAHLVEEGMTEEEVRRLEEEERQLDDAIQRHGQGRSGDRGF